jgi:hypothetical protein
MKIDGIEFKKNPHVISIGKDKATGGTLYGRIVKPQDVAQLSDEEFSKLFKTRRKWDTTGETVYARPIEPKGWSDKDNTMMFDEYKMYIKVRNQCFVATTQGI